MSKSEIKELAKEIASEAIAETQVAFSEMLIKRTEEMQTAMSVSFEYYMDQFREFGVMQMEMRDDMKIMKTDVAELKTDVAELKTDVAELKTDVAELKTDMVEVKHRLNNLEGDVGQIKNYIFKNVEPRVHILEIRDLANV